MKPWVARTLLALGTIVVLDQVAQYTLLRGGTFLGRRIAPYDPPIFAPIQSESYARIQSHLVHGDPPITALDFDAELGWCPKTEHRSELYQYDWARCRIGNQPLSRERVPGKRRVAAIGCSFTLGAEVGAKDTWEAQLERLATDLEIANLGVGGYGLDQALLRFRRDGVPLRPEEVWLGVQPEAMSRMVTTYMPALNRRSFPIGFKPRFQLGQGDELRLVPSPVRSLADVARLMGSQAEFIDAVGETDRWIARYPAAYAPEGSSILHRSAIARLVLTARERSSRHIADELRDPESELFRLARGICRTVRADAEHANARLRIFILPDKIDLELGDAHGSAYWQRWADALRADGCEVFDLEPAIRAAGGAANSKLWAPQGHYTAEGNRVVAEALARYLAGS